ncbi:putative concanavalin A-like lectin/glucanase domain, legume lectin [Medicago truncatula]|uniref:Legume lectin beta domain protein n=1 Tax=Medicago truncatula TaxID=3880 RepID=A0A072VPS0_MEDTR|nr:putative bark agglutinin LECRPA3 [Medicago truncatula]KEH43373.1 legume lectin beta domain protein [Medicago truncatula]RHN81326.1 putative concanavalin A-like lectin/glucanase domain, legume lectin [Medicago truncatula]
MALTNSNIETYVIRVMMIFTTFSLLFAKKANSKNTVIFNFPKFTKDDIPSLTLQGSADILLNGALSLTDTTHATPNVGRVLYSSPVPIWDNNTGHVVSFVTSFSFEITPWPNVSNSDGLVFFLTDPANIKIPENSGQGDLGVINSNNAFNKFVGVEFDTYANTWDPPYQHIGIDVNSLYSSKYIKWNSVSESLVKVQIIYESSSTTLTVVVTDKNGQISILAQVLDLSYLLPHEVVVGISATSGVRQSHFIYSWSFTSFLDPTKKIISDNINNVIASN